MSDKTSIEWTSATASPIKVRVRADAAEIARAKGYTSLIEIGGKRAGRVGHHCEHASHGCDHCYAERDNHRCRPGNGTGLPYDRRSRDLVEPFVDEKVLKQIMSWGEPRKIFIENQSDLFGEWVTDEMLDRVFSVMVLCSRHTFQVLTKRAKRMQEYVQSFGPDGNGFITHRGVDYTKANMISHPANWPLRNVWLGVSVEDCAHKSRIDVLHDMPSALRFLSLEPLLEDLGVIDLSGIDWVIVGGESGPGARPLDIAWVRSIVQQCRDAGVKCFVKQLGACPYSEDKLLAHEITIRQRSGLKVSVRFPLRLNDRKGGDPEEWPVDLRVREMPEVRNA